MSAPRPICSSLGAACLLSFTQTGICFHQQIEHFRIFRLCFGKCFELWRGFGKIAIGDLCGSERDLRLGALRLQKQCGFQLIFRSFQIFHAEIDLSQ